MEQWTRIEVPAPTPQMRAMINEMRRLQQQTQQLNASVQLHKQTERFTMNAGNALNVFQKFRQSLARMASKMESMMQRLWMDLGSLSRFFSGSFMGALGGTATLATGGLYAVVSATVQVTRLIYDKMVEIGTGLMTDNQFTMGRLSNVGSYRSLRLNFGGLPGDISETMGNVARGAIGGPGNFDQYIALHFLGVPTNKDRSDMTVSAVIAAWRWTHGGQRGGRANLLPQAEANRLTALFSPDQLIALANMSKAELDRLVAQYDQDKADFEVKKSAQEAFIQFAVQLNRMWTTIWSSIGNRLADPHSPMVQALSRVAAAFEQVVAAFLASKPVQDSINAILDWLRRFLARIAKFNNQEWLRSIAKELTAWMEAGKGAFDSIHDFIDKVNEWMATIRKIVAEIKSWLPWYGETQAISPEQMERDSIAAENEERRRRARGELPPLPHDTGVQTTGTHGWEYITNPQTDEERAYSEKYKKTHPDWQKHMGAGEQPILDDTPSSPPARPVSPTPRRLYQSPIPHQPPARPVSPTPRKVSISQAAVPHQVAGLDHHVVRNWAGSALAKTSKSPDYAIANANNPLQHEDNSWAMNSIHNGDVEHLGIPRLQNHSDSTVVAVRARRGTTEGDAGTVVGVA